MCGRFTLAMNLETLKQFLEADYQIQTLPESIDLPRYNIAPGQKALALVSDGIGYRVGYMQWGFVPSWADSSASGPRPINARGETLASKPFFREAAGRRRCVLLADGFYEWETRDSGKVPYFFQRPGGEPFLLGGIWSKTRDGEGRAVPTFAIVTTRAGRDLEGIHERMPLAMRREESKQWMDPEATDVSALLKDLGTPEAGFFERREVSSRVNSPANDDPSLLKGLR